MGRLGNIGSQVVSSRLPTKVYTKLLNEADDKGIAIGVYIRDILSQDNFSQGGQTKIEYRDKIVEVPKIEYRDRIIEKPINTLVEYKDKIVYKDRIVEKIVEKKIEVDNPKLLLKIQELEKYIYELSMAICLPNKNKKP